MIDFISIFNRYNLEFVSTGPNVAKGHIAVHCPWCGDADKSQHLGINLKTGEWGCWRSSQHRGRSLTRLLKALLRVTYEEIQYLVQDSPLDSFSSVVKNLTSPPTTLKKSVKNHRLSPEIKPLSSLLGYAPIFLKYLESRGFSKGDIPSLISEWKLCYTLAGKWRWRLIFPIFFDGKLVSWTGRAIKENPLRYLSNSIGEGENIKDYLLHYDELMKNESHVLVVTEGPIDAIKMDFYGRDKGVRATCLFGLSISTNQTYLLKSLTENYERVVFILDPTTLSEPLTIAYNLPFKVEFKLLKNDVEDLGAFTPNQIRELSDQLTSTYNVH